MISSVLDGIPLLLLPPDLDASATARSSMVDMDEFEGDVGAGIGLTHSTLPNTTEQVTFLCKSRAELDELEQFIRALDGRARPFWIPTWTDDVDVLAANAGSLTIADIDYQTNFFPSIAHRWLLVCPENDPLTWSLRVVSNVIENGDGTETLLTSTPFGSGSFTSATHRYMFLRFVRLDSDDVTIEYLGGGRAIVTLQIINIPGSYPPFNIIASTPIYLSFLDYLTNKLGNINGIPAGEPGFPNGGTATVSADPTCPFPPCFSTAPEAVFRTAPIQAAFVSGPFVVTAAGKSFADAGHFLLNGQRADIYAERASGDVLITSTSYWASYFAGGPVQGASPSIDFQFLDGDVIRVEFQSHIQLNPLGPGDDGARAKTYYGAYWSSWLYVPGIILPQ